MERRTKGQSMLEMALVLPLLVLLFSVLIEAGLALNAWTRVNTAARDATRFAVDSGTITDTASLVVNKLAGIDFGSARTSTGSLQMNVYVITGTTDASGLIITPGNWHVSHPYGSAGATAYKVQPATIQARLQDQSSWSAGVQNTDAYKNMPFVIVEVDYNYTPLLGTLLAPGSRLPMTSYALIQQYSNFSN